MTRLPASLVTLNGTLSGILLDVSLFGARFLLTHDKGVLHPLRTGREVILEWGTFDAIGTIVWEADCLCGILFEPNVPPETLVATRDLHDQLIRQGGLRQMQSDKARDWFEGKVRF